MQEIKDKFLNELLNSPPELVASLWILDGVPYPFKENKKQYAEWRHKLSSMIKVDSSEIVIIGSGAFGVSLNPNKNYRFYDDNSDIDVAIISEYFFNTSWRHLRNLGTDIHRMSPAAKQSVIDHVHKYIYWGTIATDKLLPYLPFGPQWSEALREMSKIDPTKNRQIKARIYKDFESLRTYQVNNLKNLRTQELEKGIENV